MENQSTIKKVLVVVSGGVVQSVFASDRNVIIDILDFDNEEFDNANEADEEFEKRKIDLYNIL